MRVEQLRVQGFVEPVGIDTKNPVFSYILKSNEENQYQTAYRILVSSSYEQLKADKADLWDSGKQVIREPFGIKYDGILPATRQRIFWKVKVWDKYDNASEWSTISFWEMGLLHAADWVGEWIGQGDQFKGNKSTAPMLLCDFNVEDITSIKSARLYISGLGIFRASMNGKRIASTYFDPGESDASATVYYVTYDILEFLCQGCNSFGVVLGNGQYCGFLENPVMTDRFGNELPAHRYQKNDASYVKAGISGDKKLLAQIEVTYLDGSVSVIAKTDETWKWIESPVIFQNWYGGEDYDATKEIEGWNVPGVSREHWNQAVVMEPPGGRVKGREFYPVVITDRVSPVRVFQIPNGNWLVDMGINAAGFPEITIETTPDMRGKWIRMYPGEMLKKDGFGVSQASSTQSWNERYHCSIIDSYCIKGTGVETWHPEFCYHGFQYIEIENYPGVLSADHISYCIVRTGNEKTGYFQSSNALLNRISNMIDVSMESNMMSAFTDCPHIEKLGWIETSHLMFRSLSVTYDIRSWMRKIISDIMDSQVQEGQKDSEPAGFIPGIVPEYQRIGGLYRDPNWNGACIFTPWEYYKFYGETDILEIGYPVMKRYMEYLQMHITNGVLADYAHMGEWGEYGENTPGVLVATCSYYRLLNIMSRIAGILNEKADEDIYLELCNATWHAFHEDKECFDKETGVYGSGSQASYGCALFSGLVPKEREAEVVNKLICVIEKNGNHLTSGEVGLKQVFNALGEHNRSDVVYHMIMNETSPSYRYFAEKGLTALPEYWNCDELWHGMERSRNHAMMGHAKEWMITYLLGIRSMTPGFTKIKIHSFLPTGIDELKGGIVCPYGEIKVKLIIEESELKMTVEIPAGTTAVIYRPLFEESDCKKGRIALLNDAFKEVGSGIHHLKYDLPERC